MSIKLDLNKIWNDFLFSWENKDIFPSEVFFNIFGVEDFIKSPLSSSSSSPSYPSSPKSTSTSTSTSTLLLYHGAPNTCSNLTCGECNGCDIMKNGLNLANSNKSSLKIGKRIFLTSNSSIANDYTSENIDGYRCLFICSAIVEYKINNNNNNNISNYNSNNNNNNNNNEPQIEIYSKGNEYIVYNQNQVVPIMAIIYKTDIISNLNLNNYSIIFLGPSQTFEYSENKPNYFFKLL